MKQTCLILVFTAACKLALAQWIPMNNTTNATSYSMIEYNNELYAGGPFQHQLQRHNSQLTETNLSHIAKWNGTSWDSLGAGTDAAGYVLCMAVYDSALIVGGGFSTMNGLPANRIAKWNGSFFDSLGSGMRGVSSGKIMALAIYNQELYAGGIFDSAGGVPARNIARWNGSLWDSVGSGVTTQVHSLQVYNGELYVGGIITRAGGLPVNDIARWSGTSWNNVGGELDGAVLTMQVYQNLLYVGGEFYNADTIRSVGISSWDGNNWASPDMGLPAGGQVFTLQTYNDELIVGGQFTQAGGITANQIAAWDGTNWSTLGSGTEFPALGGCNVFVTYPYQGNLFISGTFQYIGGTDTSYYMAQYYEGAETGIKAINSPANILIYPNPATEQITLTTAGNGILTISNEPGQVLRQICVIGNQTTISTQNLLPGIYLLTFQTGEEFLRGKLIIQR